VKAISQSITPIHGGQLRQIAARFEVPSECLVDFSANINPAGPPPGVLSAIQHALKTPETVVAYPDLELTELKRSIARYAGVRPKNIAVANGFVPLLEATLRSLKVTRCLLPVPSFNEYRRTLENTGIIVIPHQLAAGKGFRYELDDLLQALQNNACDSVLLANPQNPSGALCEAGQMRQLMTTAAERGVSVLLDEAFIDYSSSQSLTRFAAEQPNVIVFRSVTKFFAIPGLRVAYAVGQFGGIEAMNRLIAPWPVTSLASDAVCAALCDEEYADQTRILNKRRRAWLEEELARLNVTTYPASANFLLLRFSDEVNVAGVWERMIVQERIVLRSCANFEGLMPGHLRVAVRSEVENERMIRALKRVLRSDG
jgi:threonine-phosphate decarboxylase